MSDYYRTDPPTVAEVEAHLAAHPAHEESEFSWLMVADGWPYFMAVGVHDGEVVVEEPELAESDGHMLCEFEAWDGIMAPHTYVRLCDANGTPVEWPDVRDWRSWPSRAELEAHEDAHGGYWLVNGDAPWFPKVYEAKRDERELVLGVSGGFCAAKDTYRAESCCPCTPDGTPVPWPEVAE